MFRHALKATALGVVGLLVGCAVVWGAVSIWSSLSTNWINAGAILPLMGLVGGFALAGPELVPNRRAFRAILAAVAIVLGTSGNYLAYVITSRTWFADRIPVEQQSFLYQVSHPDSLPRFVQRSSSSARGMEQTWGEYVVIGAVASPIVFWFLTRRMR